MKNQFANFLEADKYLRKHYDFPRKVKTVVARKAEFIPATDKHPAIPTLRSGLSYEYHGRSCKGAWTVHEEPIPLPDHPGEWGSRSALDKPWFFVDRETWKEITEEEFIQALKDMLKDEK